MSDSGSDGSAARIRAAVASRARFLGGTEPDAEVTRADRYLTLVDDATVWERFLAVPEEPGSHVVLLDDHTVLMSSSAPAAAQLFRDRGLDVVTVDMTEFEKLEGCVTCLSVRLRG